MELELIKAQVWRWPECAPILYQKQLPYGVKPVTFTGAQILNMYAIILLLVSEH
jgi:hypothetical protein